MTLYAELQKAVVPKELILENCKFCNEKTRSQFLCFRPHALRRVADHWLELAHLKVIHWWNEKSQTGWKEELNTWVEAAISQISPQYNEDSTKIQQGWSDQVPGDADDDDNEHGINLTYRANHRMPLQKIRSQTQRNPRRQPPRPRQPTSSSANVSQSHLSPVHLSGSWSGPVTCEEKVSKDPMSPHPSDPGTPAPRQTVVDEIWEVKKQLEISM